MMQISCLDGVLGEREEERRYGPDMSRPEEH